MGKNKRHTWFDENISYEERLNAYNKLDPNSKTILSHLKIKPGVTPSLSQMDSLYKEMENESIKELFTACNNAKVTNTIKNIDIIIGKLNKCLALADGTEDYIGEAWGLIEALVDEQMFRAYINFRDFPSVELYQKCWALRKIYDTLGFDLPGEYPVNPWPRCIIKEPLKIGVYIVKVGDSLSKISGKYYGNVNLWDAIYESNNYKGHPDLIYPGSKLEIQQIY